MVLSPRRIRACLGGVWLIDAILQAQPHFFSRDWWTRDLAQSVMGQPAAISHSILWVIGLIAPHAALADASAVGVQAGIGLCLLLGRFERVALIASVPWAVGIWWIGEGLGALPTGFAVVAGGLPGPALLYPLVGIICWPPHDSAGEGRDTRWCGRLALGSWVGIWAAGAIAGLPWRQPAAAVLQANIEQNGQGQPHWLTQMSSGAYHLVGLHPLLVPAALLTAQLAVGLGVLDRRTRRPALFAGTALALLFWVTVQSLGGLAGGGSTDPGSAPLLVLLAWAVEAATGPATTPAPTSGAPVSSRRLWRTPRSPRPGCGRRLPSWSTRYPNAGDPDRRWTRRWSPAHLRR